MEFILPGSRQRGDGSAVEGILQSHDPVFLRRLLHAPFSRQFNSAFVGLCSGVAKKYFGKAGGFANFFCQLCLHRIIVQVGNVLKLSRLMGNRLHPAFITPAQGIYTNTTGKIYVVLSFRIPGGYTLAFYQCNREPAIGMHHVCLFLLLYLFKIHGKDLLNRTWCQRPRRRTSR